MGPSQRLGDLKHRSAATHLLGLRVRIPPEHGCLSLVSVVCFQVQVSASGWSLIQRNPTECGVSNECNFEPQKGEAMTRKRVQAPWWGGGDMPNDRTRISIVKWIARHCIRQKAVQSCIPSRRRLKTKWSYKVFWILKPHSTILLRVWYSRYNTNM